ncbi:glycosyl transferase family 2 [Thioalkalivibrio sp. K90mix]|uniref:glycosyltransferase family 2 protein n=1 Tax=Thioalkalivibrio sp. (strain K90mix) TaxID=396595 RepID=UPI000195A9CC|nr:glycosyltransferase [Thioalkalivibrio sp. K90mix]ADC70826.1 glycosyl transferase family 2 [Thioalkalivibrio sp. K90mix]
MSSHTIVPGRISISIPHWQVLPLLLPCLRSIRKNTSGKDVEVIVIDNGSKDESLDYLRSLEWIRLIERPEEGLFNFPDNVWTSHDIALKEATGEFLVTMHTDLFVKRGDWLDEYLKAMAGNPRLGGVGTWKLELKNPVYEFQKRVFHVIRSNIKYALGLRKKRYEWKQGHYPKDFCAMYRRQILLDEGLTFRSIEGKKGFYDQSGGYSISAQLWDKGYPTRVIPVRTMIPRIVHLGHGTAAVSPEKAHRRNQHKLETRRDTLFDEPWVQELQSNVALDR